MSEETLRMYIATWGWFISSMIMISTAFMFYYLNSPMLGFIFTLIAAMFAIIMYFRRSKLSEGEEEYPDEII